MLVFLLCVVSWQCIAVLEDRAQQSLDRSDQCQSDRTNSGASGQRQLFLSSESRKHHVERPRCEPILVPHR